MTTQGPSTLNPSDISLGNLILYYAPAPFESFSAAKAATTWRKFGLMKQGVELNVTKEVAEFFSGFPAKLQQQYVTTEDLRIAGEMLEVNPRNLARVLGGLTITETVKASSPAPTTVATGSTKSSLICASVTGFEVGTEIRVGTGAGNYQYGRIKAINTGTKTITFFEDLSGDTAPTVGHAVAEVDTVEFPLGDLALPDELALKASYQCTGSKWSMDLYVLKAQMSGNLQMAFQDNTQNADAIGLPFEVRALSDPLIESGKTALFHWGQAA